MPKKLLITFMAFAFVGILVFLVGWAGATQEVALPQRITPEVLCPVAGCAQREECHAAAKPPFPDGTFEMICPRVRSCSDTDCHAWDRIEATRSKPSDASMNLWILAPVILVVTLVVIVRKL